MHPILALFRRNEWANQKLLDFCAQQPAEVAAAPAEGDVYGGIDAQFTHMVSAETGYLPWITGRRREDRISGDTPLRLEELREPMRWAGTQWPEALDFDRDPEEVFQVQRRSGQSAMTDWLALLQLLHHGDDHRNQVATVLSRHGVEPPDLDCWAFLPAPSPLAFWSRRQAHETAIHRADVESALRVRPVYPKEFAADGIDELLLGAFAAAAGSEGADSGDGRTGRRDAVLRRAFAHHIWATTKMLERCVEMTDDQLGLTAPGTFGSILDTLDHLVSSDRSYLSRLQGHGRQPPLNAGEIGPLLEHFSRSAEGWLEYLDSQPDFAVLIPLRTGGEAPAWVVVMQAVHHGNDHRTHIGTALMHNGLDTPDLDPWSYALASHALEVPG